MNRTIDALIAAQLEMGDSDVTNGERGAATVEAHSLTQQLVDSGDVPSNDRTPLHMTLL